MAHGKQTIWKLVARCAETLTETGQSPFTRGEIIRCIRRTNPEYRENSINPIIQGVTDNLKGGAPGAVGKNILHSVARGRFVLISSVEVETRRLRVPKLASHRDAASPTQDESISKQSLSLGNEVFSYVAKIVPETNTNGSIREYHPQSRFENDGNLALNKYGKGPFCKFKIPRGIDQSGVYALVVNRKVKYVGECRNLSERYNTGYGSISPRNCYRGGQETNCRINNLIFMATASNSDVTLWFHPTKAYKEIELNLRKQLAPEWNRI